MFTSNWWLSISSDDQEVLWNNREPMETNPRKNELKQQTLCSGGLSVASLLDYPGLGVGLSAGHLTKNIVIENSSGLDCVLSGGLSAVWARTVREDLMDILHAPSPRCGSIGVVSPWLPWARFASRC